MAEEIALDNTLMLVAAGTIPCSVGKLTSITFLNFGTYSLVGIPSNLGKLARLQLIYLDTNSNKLTGFIHLSFTGLTSLSVGHFIGKSLNGIYPSSDICSMTKLTTFYITQSMYHNPTYRRISS